MLSTICSDRHIDFYLDAVSHGELCTFDFRARPLKCPGAELENVKLLESYKDTTEMYQMSVGNKAVIGTSFTGKQKTNKKKNSFMNTWLMAIFQNYIYQSGMEVAACLSDKASVFC